MCARARRNCSILSLNFLRACNVWKSWTRSLFLQLESETIISSLPHEKAFHMYCYVGTYSIKLLFRRLHTHMHAVVSCISHLHYTESRCSTYVRRSKEFYDVSMPIPDLILVATQYLLYTKFFSISLDPSFNLKASWGGRGHFKKTSRVVSWSLLQNLFRKLLRL